jgi:hypothetical protein
MRGELPSRRVISPRAQRFIMEKGSFLTKMEIGYEFRDLHHVFGIGTEEC